MGKTSFALAFGAGYILGARAGRQRYEQIVEAWSRVTGSPKVQEAAGKTREAAAAGAKRGLSVVQKGVEKTGEAVRERLDRGDGDSADDYSR
jgi:hypothetical protein